MEAESLGTKIERRSVSLKNIAPFPDTKEAPDPYSPDIVIGVESVYAISIPYLRESGKVTFANFPLRFMLTDPSIFSENTDEAAGVESGEGVPFGME